MKRIQFIQIAGLIPMISLTLVPGFVNASNEKSSNRSLKAVVMNNLDLTSDIEFALDKLGGIRQLVKKRSRVVIKPSMAYNQKPGTGFNSDPRLVEHLIRLCYEAGAREVSVFDHTLDEWTLCYKNSGIERVAKNAEARVLPANEFMYYQPLPDNSIKSHDPLHIHQAILQADIIINVSASRTNNTSGTGGAIENFTRCFWERIIFHTHDNQLSRMLYFRKPTLNITEVWNNTPGYDDIPNFWKRQQLIVSTDLVVADEVLASLLKTEYKEVKGLEQAIHLNHEYVQLLPGQVLYID